MISQTAQGICGGNNWPLRGGFGSFTPPRDDAARAVSFFSQMLHFFVLKQPSSHSFLFLNEMPSGNLT
jgi:hypothetical protein